VEQVGAALEVQTETHRLVPRPEHGRRAEERRHEEHDRRCRQHDEQQHAVENGSAHDFCPSLSRASTAGAFCCTVWIAARSTWMRTLGAISSVTIDRKSTSELQSLAYLVCRLLLEKKK